MIEPYRGTVKKVAKAPNPLSVKRKKRAQVDELPVAKKRRAKSSVDNNGNADGDDDDEKPATDKRPVGPLRRIAKKRGVRGGKRTRGAKAKALVAKSNVESVPSQSHDNKQSIDDDKSIDKILNDKLTN